MLKTSPTIPFVSSHNEFPAYKLKLIKLIGLDATFYLYQQASGKDVAEVDIIGTPEGVANIEVSADDAVLTIAAKAASAGPADVASENEVKGRLQGAVSAMKGISVKLNAVLEDNPLRVIVYLPAGVEVEAENLAGRIVANGILKLKAETKDGLDIDTVYSLDLTASGRVTVMAMAGTLTLTANKGADVYIHSGTIMEANITARNGGKVFIHTVVGKGYLHAFDGGAIYVTAVKEVKARHTDKNAQIIFGSD